MTLTYFPKFIVEAASSFQFPSGCFLDLHRITSYAVMLQHKWDYVGH